MMSLVDYGGSSSDSENDDTQAAFAEDTAVKEVKTTAAVEIPQVSKDEAEPEIEDLDNETPSSNFQCDNDEVEENLKMRVPGNIKLEEIIRSKPKKKKKGKVLISMTTFDDSDSDEDAHKPAPTSRVVCGPRKGLNALLPPPKAMIVREGNRPMIPHAVARKQPPPAAKPRPPPAADKEEEEEPLTSFFTLEAEEVVPEMPVRPPPKPTTEEAPEAGPARPTPEQLSAPAASFSFDQSMPVDFIPQIELRNQRKRRRDEPVDMIEVRQADLTAGVEIELTKGVSQEEDEFKKTQSENMPGRLAAAKHQITWLAYKAKEQEFELKNSWATAKFNKMQTRNKYGF